uniref:Putative amphiphysin n=1 Tax=Xenopsylla cheopis TaxID=163159 RepID=A0A6M2DPP8_XENCH
MAESKGALLAKSVQKHAGRAKEKILQNLGKVDRTADEIFDEHLQNFTKQQNSANRLQKEFNNYIRCIRAVQSASKSLMEAVSEVYESPWSGHDVLLHQTNALEMLWQDFSHKLGDQVLIPLNTYQAQFPEMRKKVDKRGRKLVDYDSQRHSFQGLQANANKKRDDAKVNSKVTRGRELLEEAKRTYEQLNSELHDELPALYDSRVLFLVTNLQTLFTSEQLFHQETAKVYAELEAIVDKLATDSQRGSYTIKKMNSVLPSGGTLPHSPKNNLQSNNLNNSKPSSPIKNALPESPTKSIASSGTSVPNDNGSNNNLTASSNPSSVIMTPSTPPSSPPPPSSSPPPLTPNLPKSEIPAPVLNNDTAQTKLSNGDHTVDSLTETNAAAGDGKQAAILPSVNQNLNTSSDTNKNVTPPASAGELYDIPVSATTTDLPPGVLYRVKATYKYNREDVDELSFEVGDVIRVIEYDDPEEQEEGWLMGLKEGTNEKGMFPANFTRPI